MAEGFLKSFDPLLQVFSAGTVPAEYVNPSAVKVMKEIGIDISHLVPKSVDQYLNRSFDYLITVCDHAKETCPVFSGHVEHRMHLGFEDPAEARGSDDDVLSVFRRVRDQIKEVFHRFYTEEIAQYRSQ